MRSILPIALMIGCASIVMRASFDAAQDKPFESVQGGPQAPPPWAYTVNPPPTPGATPAPVDPAPRQVPGTTVTFTVAQTRDAYNPPDWHPNGHPPMRQAIALGRPKEMRASASATS